MSFELTTAQQLLIPFKAGQIHWRVGSVTKDKSKAMALAYLDSRDVMRRLDDVLGIDGWQCNYTTDGDVLICNIGIKVNGQWVWRANGGAESNTEPEKGKASSAFKRAAVLFGIGRYLYQMPNKWCAIDQYKNLTETPPLPQWATPEGYIKIIEKQQANKND